MKAFVAKRWFLLLVCLAAILVGGVPQGLRWTAYLDPSVSGATAIFLSAWSLDSRKLLGAVVRPWAALWALVISYGLLPVLACLLGLLLPPGDFRIGLLLIASVPCTLASAVIWTRMAAGNDATALLITLFTNLSSWLATTAWLALATGVTAGQVDPPGMMTRLFLVLVVPVALGQLLRAIGPPAQVADRHRIFLSILARLLTVTIMLKAAMHVRERLENGTVSVSSWLLVAVAALCLTTHLGAFASGFWSSKVLGFAHEDQVAVALGGSQKTLPVSLILFDAYFTAYPVALIPVALFHLEQLIADTFRAAWCAGRRPALSTAANFGAESAI
jgi:sodium/bile acid cotransporter 7